MINYYYYKILTVLTVYPLASYYFLEDLFPTSSYKYCTVALYMQRVHCTAHSDMG